MFLIKSILPRAIDTLHLYYCNDYSRPCAMASVVVYRQFDHALVICAFSLHLLMIFAFCLHLLNLFHFNHVTALLVQLREALQQLQQQHTTASSGTCSFCTAVIL
jgi:hypothetical protein